MPSWKERNTSILRADRSNPEPKKPLHTPDPPVRRPLASRHLPIPQTIPANVPKYDPRQFQALSTGLQEATARHRPADLPRQGRRSVAGGLPAPYRLPVTAADPSDRDSSRNRNLLRRSSRAGERPLGPPKRLVHVQRTSTARSHDRHRYALPCPRPPHLRHESAYLPRRRRGREADARNTRLPCARGHLPAASTTSPGHEDSWGWPDRRSPPCGPGGLPGPCPPSEPIPAAPRHRAPGRRRNRTSCRTRP